MSTGAPSPNCWRRGERRFPTAEFRSYKFAPKTGRLGNRPSWRQESRPPNGRLEIRCSVRTYRLLDYETYVRGLAEASGVKTPTREELIRFDRKRKKKMSKVPSTSVRESAAHSGPAGATVTAAAERVGGATVRASVRDRGVGSDLRPGARQRAQATADPCLRIQPGIADASPDGGRHASESPKPRLDAPFYGYLGPNGVLDSQESPLGAFLGVGPARFAVLRSWNSSLAVRGESPASTETVPAPAGQGASEGAYREYVSR